MASWCWICRHKVDQTYVYYKGEKCHRGCMKTKKEQEEAKKRKQEKSKNE